MLKLKYTREEIRDFIRNITGRFQLFLVLFRWDRAYRREVWVTILAFSLINYSILDLDNPFDWVALLIEGVIIWIQLGNEFSILPKEYRPHYNGISFGGQTVTALVHGDGAVPFAEVLPPAEEEPLEMYNPFRDMPLSKETALCSDSLDDYLMTAEHLPYKVVEPIGSYISSVHQIRYLAIRVANKKQHTTNGEKLCMAGSAASLMSGRPVPVRQSDYFNALLTGEAFRSRITCPNLRGGAEVNADLTQYYPIEEDNIDGSTVLRLASDYYDRVSGQIGATTLILSENNRVIMLFQGEGKAIDANKVTLGGSGSMDFKDIERNAREDLRDAVVRCMAREATEETGLEDYYGTARTNTRLTGFFHWMDRSGKPEFVGITKAGDIPFADRSSIDHDEIVRTEEIPVDIKSLGDFKKVMDYIIKNEIRVGLSSLVALHRLTVIAKYHKLPAADIRKKIYKDLSDFLFA